MSLNTILNDIKEKSTNKITIKCQIIIGTTNSQRVRGVTSTQYSLKREQLSSPVASTTWRPLDTVLNKTKWEHSHCDAKCESENFLLRNVIIVIIIIVNPSRVVRLQFLRR